MRATRTAAFAIAIALSLPSLASSPNSKERILADFKLTALPRQKQRNHIIIEICRDLCDYFIARRARSEAEVWDVIFLWEFYFDQDILNEAFRVKNARHPAAVFNTHSPLCSSAANDEARARCLVKRLAQRNEITYAFVRYDEGYRCQVPGNINYEAKLSNKGKCTRYKHAP